VNVTGPLVFMTSCQCRIFSQHQWTTNASTLQC